MTLAARAPGVDRYLWRRLFAEALGTFFLVLVAAGAGMVNARFGGNAIPLAAQVTAPGLMVGAIILSMGAISGAHLNPGVSIAFALRRDFPWSWVPGYVVAQFVGGIVAALLLIGLLGRQGDAGLTLPGPGITDTTAMLWETLLAFGLVTTVLGTASGAQNVGPLAAIGVASYIILAGLFGAPVSGASMNGVRSLAPAIVLGNLTAAWAYVVGPIAGAVLAAGVGYLLRGAGGGTVGRQSARGTLGSRWAPGPIEVDAPDGPAPVGSPGSTRRSSTPDRP